MKINKKFMLVYSLVRMVLGGTILLLPTPMITELGVNFTVQDLELYMMISMIPILLFDAFLAFKYREAFAPLAIAWSIGTIAAFVLQMEIDIIAAMTLCTLTVGSFIALIWLFNTPQQNKQKQQAEIT